MVCDPHVYTDIMIPHQMGTNCQINCPEDEYIAEGDRSDWAFLCLSQIQHYISTLTYASFLAYITTVKSGIKTKNSDHHERHNIDLKIYSVL